jgi:hypothetical protein
MKRRYRLELGSHLAGIEGVASGARQAHVLARDSRSDALTGEVRARGGPAGQHILPLGKQTEFAQAVRVRFRRIGGRGSVEALPSRWKDSGGGKGRLPPIEVGPQEIRSAGLWRHRRPFDQSQRPDADRVETATTLTASLGPR